MLPVPEGERFEIPAGAALRSRQRLRFAQFLPDLGSSRPVARAVRRDVSGTRRLLASKSAGSLNKRRIVSLVFLLQRIQYPHNHPSRHRRKI